jgi:hypothetical protein
MWEVRAGSICIRAAAAAYTENDDKTSIGTSLKLNAPVHPQSQSLVGEYIKVQAARSKKPGIVARASKNAIVWSGSA